MDLLSNHYIQAGIALKGLQYIVGLICAAMTQPPRWLLITKTILGDININPSLPSLRDPPTPVLGATITKAI